MPHRIPSAPRPAPSAPSSTTPATTPSTTPSTVVPEPSNPNGLARGHDVFGQPPVTPARTPSALTEALYANAGRNVALVPGRAPGAVGLDVLLRQLGTSAEGRALVEKLCADLEAKTGVPVPENVKAAALRDPAVLTRAMELSPAALSRGMDAVNAAYKLGKLEQIAERTLHLPQRFDLADTARVELPRETPAMKALAPGLLQGDLPSSLSDDALRDNRVVAEVLHRLSENAGKPTAERFSVAYAGSTFTRLDTFLDALRRDGHDVQVSFEQRVANFSNLKTQVPGSEPPRYLDVPAPLLVKTGVVDALGQEAVVPAAHAEMIVRIRSGSDTRGPGVNADVKFYQGISGTGFFPVGGAATPEWCGAVVSGELTGDEAMRAVKLAGLFTDVVNDAARAQDLYMGGYGVTGVCNDSVAVIQQALTGTTTMYPLLMRDGVLMGELQARLGDADRRDDPSYRALADAIRALPSDTAPNATSAARALLSLPWAKGEEPLQSSVDARRILGG